jgi:preprotein translocase subunit SecA
MINEINDGTVSVLMRVKLPMAEPGNVREAPAQQAQRPKTTEHKENLDELSETQKAMQQAAAHAGAQRGPAGPQQRKPVVNNGPKVGRNDPCPCGSGKKYKACHGKGLPA